MKEKQFIIERECNSCGGSGEAPKKPCKCCGGHGTESKLQTVSVQIPPGVADGETLKIKNAGNVGENGGQSGDLFVTVNVKPP